MDLSQLTLGKIKIKDSKQALLFLLLFLIGIFLIFGLPFTATSKVQEEAPLSPDTYIPRGYTLVPIELQNTESISSLIQDFAIVDLYAGSFTQKKARKIGSRLRLLRAPLNPDRFAVLVPDSQAGLILGADGPISASILNRTQDGQGNLEQVQKTIKPSIQYYEGGS